MPEVIITMVFPAEGDEPAYTHIRRMEFDTSADMQAWYNTRCREFPGLVSEEELSAR